MNVAGTAHSSTPPAFAPAPKILFADDDFETLELFKFHSDRHGWSADFVTSAPKILDKVNESLRPGAQHYDCIVADINYFDDKTNPIHSMTGIAAGKRLRQSGLDVPILIVSGMSNQILKDEVKKITSETLVLKPFDWDSLFERIEFLVKWYRAVTRSRYEGVERRKKSINITRHKRRSGDTLEMPRVFAEIEAENEFAYFKSEIFQAMSDAQFYGVLIVNAQGNIVASNKAATRMFGYLEKELTGRNVSTLMPERFRKSHREKFEEAVKLNNYERLGQPIQAVGLHSNGSEFELKIAISNFMVREIVFFTALLMPEDETLIKFTLED